MEQFFNYKKKWWKTKNRANKNFIQRVIKKEDERDDINRGRG